MSCESSETQDTAQTRKFVLGHDILQVPKGRLDLSFQSFQRAEECKSHRDGFQFNVSRTWLMVKVALSCNEYCVSLWSPFYKKTAWGFHELAQWIKALVTKPDDLGSIPPTSYRELLPP